MTEKEAMKLALEAFKTLTQYNMVRANIFRRFEPTCTGDYVDLREFREKAEPAITALREALAEQPAQQEPVAWRYTDARGHYRYRGFVADFDKEYPMLKPQALYTTPQAQPAQQQEEQDLLYSTVAMQEREAQRIDRIVGVIERVKQERLAKIAATAPQADRAIEAKLKEKNT